MIAAKENTCLIRISWLISSELHLRCSNEEPILEGILEEPGLLQEGTDIEESGSDFGYAYRVFDNEDILLELDGQNNILARYTHGPGIDEPLIMERGGASFFYHADGLGSITEITDATGALKQQYTYSSFGKIESQLDPNFIQPYTFTAREYDSETGLYFYRARYYDPNTGRFNQEDPLFASRPFPTTNPRLTHLHVYVGNNPVLFADPLGLLTARQIRIVAITVLRSVFGLSTTTILLDLLGGPQCIGGCPLNEGEAEFLRKAREAQELQEIGRQLDELRRRVDELCRIFGCGSLDQPVPPPPSEGTICRRTE